MNRVVITGIGVVTPIGNTRDAFWSALVEARSGIGPVTLIPTERLNIRIAAQVLDFKPAEHFDPRRESLLDRFAQFAVVAARSALRDSQLELTEEMTLDAATERAYAIADRLPKGVRSAAPQERLEIDRRVSNNGIIAD